MKRIISVILVIVFCELVLVGNGYAQDDAGKAASFIRDILGGDTFEQELLKDHPGGKLIWKEQMVEDGEKHFTSLVYSEFTQPGEDPRYYFYEVKVRFLPPEEMFQDIPSD